MRHVARHLTLGLLLPVLALPLAAPAQSEWSFDPSVLASSGSDLLARAPDAQVDGLFQVVNDAAQAEASGSALCALFVPGADRSLSGLNDFAAQLQPAQRSRFANAVADALVAAMQSPPQAFDRAAATQSLKAAGATAAILHEGFIAGLSADGSNAEANTARCRSLRWMLQAMQSRALPERAAMTRLLLDEGLARVDAQP